MSRANFPKQARIHYETTTWALSFACKVISVRNDLDFTEIYELAYDYVDNLPNLIRFCPQDIALAYLEGGM